MIPAKDWKIIGMVNPDHQNLDFYATMPVIVNTQTGKIAHGLLKLPTGDIPYEVIYPRENYLELKDLSWQANPGDRIMFVSSKFIHAHTQKDRDFLYNMCGFSPDRHVYWPRKRGWIGVVSVKKISSVMDACRTNIFHSLGKEMHGIDIEYHGFLPKFDQIQGRKTILVA